MPVNIRPMGKARRSAGHAFSQYNTTHNEAISWMDDFLGADLNAIESGDQGFWETVEVALNLAPGIVEEEHGGVVQMTFDADSGASDAVLYTNDNRQFSAKHALFFECYMAVEVIPGTGVTAVWGMCGDHNLDKDTATESAWFRLQADENLLTETDDTGTNTDDIDTGIDLVAAEWHLYQIDFANLGNVKFFVDGRRVNESQTFDMSTLTDAEAHLQPYFSLDKASGTSLGTFYIDYVKIFAARQT